MSFQSFGLANSLLASLERLNFKKPTPVQEEAIPVVLAGNDVLISSQTGTGKTGVFSIPIISKLLEDRRNLSLIITPTRELATQIFKTFESFLGKKSPLNTALLIGGDSISKQLQQLKKKPHIIVGTPGRINDHLQRRSLKLNATKFLVLDETDRMLDMGFSIQIDDIVKHIPSDRQTLLLSATIPKNIITLSKKYMRDPKRIAIGSTYNPVEKIKQEVIRIKDDAKYSELVEQLSKRKGSVVIFVKTKFGTERMAKKLRLGRHKADAIHGDLRHNRREKVMDAFRNKKYRILVATDVASRGLDIPHIQHVINYDMPQCPEDYIHRIGRTARAGQDGESLSFVSPADKKKWDAIHYLMHPNEKKETSTPQRKKGHFTGKRNKRSFRNNRNKTI